MRARMKWPSGTPPIAGTKGYVLGGYTGAATNKTDLFTFSSETAALATTANLSSSRYDPASVANAGIKGYTAGGYLASSLATTDLTTFSTDITAASTASNLTGARDGTAGISECTSKGYWLGGSTNGGAGGLTNVSDKVTFSTDVTAASTASNLSSPRWGPTGMSNGSSKGYACGGQLGHVTDMLTFSTDVTIAVTTANPTFNGYFSAACSNGSTNGYLGGGGLSAGFTAVTDRIVFSTDVCSAVTTANLSQARGNLSGFSSGSVAGYFLGGYTNNVVGTIDKLTFSTETTAAIAGTLSTPKSDAGGMSDLGY